MEVEHPHEPKVRLKFKAIRFGRQCLLPQGYRLATLEEFRNNRELFEKWGLPIIEGIEPSYTGRDYCVRFLDGSVSSYFVNKKIYSFLPDENYSLLTNSEWILAVKKKEWDSGVQQWRNCSAFNSSDGNVLRKQLYDGIDDDRLRNVKTAWCNAYFFEDVDLLYWLWHNHRCPFDSNFFNFNIASDVGFLLMKMMERLMESHEPRSQLQMENASEEVSTVLNYAIHGGRCDWAVALVELFEEVYGSAFVETAAAITFRNVESVPIFTKLLSLCPNQLQDQISNIKPRFAEVLIEAVERGYSELVQKMMSEFKDDDIAHITTDERVRALRAAVHRGYIKLVESLLKSRNGTDLPVEVDDKGKTLFHYALFHEQVFKLLQEMYASSYHNIITRQDKFGRNFLHCAAKGDCDSQVVYNILEESITSDKRLVLCHQRDDRGRTPLHIAASKGYSGMIEKLLLYFEGEEKTKYFQETDSFGRKLLQMAAVGGHEDLVQMLLELGSQPLKERDGQKRTALHYAAQVKDPKLALATCKALVESRRLNDKDKSLLLWASGNGIGTADEMKNVNHRVKAYLREEKLRYREDLLRNALVTDNAEMAWELLNRGADMADILDPDWRESLNTSEESSVKNVISHIERMKEQGRDQPSMDDNLGRHVFAEGVAALLLNRFVESPITVGISGECGMGKSSLMIQIEKILLITAAQLTFPNLLPSEQFGGAKKIYLSTRGRKIYRQNKRGVHNILTPSKCESENPLVTMLTEYQSQYHAVYKSLACMDFTLRASVTTTTTTGTCIKRSSSHFDNSIQCMAL